LFPVWKWYAARLAHARCPTERGKKIQPFVMAAAARWDTASKDKWTALGKEVGSTFFLPLFFLAPRGKPPGYLSRPVCEISDAVFFLSFFLQQEGPKTEIKNALSLDAAFSSKKGNCWMFALFSASIVDSERAWDLYGHLIAHLSLLSHPASTKLPWTTNWACCYTATANELNRLISALGGEGNQTVKWKIALGPFFSLTHVSFDTVFRNH
jgi:hypothetical protein